MKPEVLNALLTARTLFDTARLQCFVRDRHVASAGLVVLQDALELVFYACLLDIGVDEKKNIEGKGFDELVGELKSLNLKVPKSGTLKAMNKQRVLIKHHAQLAEPVAVQNYYEASSQAADSVLTQVIGKPLQHIVIADAISKPELALHINEASQAIESGKYLEAMISTRKALFLAVEFEYDIRLWEDYDPASTFPSVFRFANKAPFVTRNKDWIQQNVKEPTEYVQLDHERLSIDMMQLGIDSEEFFNVWRLTPKVYRREDKTWAVKCEAEHTTNADENNARYCLDVVISILMKQQLRSGIVRSRGYNRWRARLLKDQPLLTRASYTSPEEGRLLRAGEVHDVGAIVSGLDEGGEFVEIVHIHRLFYFTGFIPRDSCDIEDGYDEGLGVLCSKCFLFNTPSRPNCERCGEPLEKEEAEQ